jgi:hypothetical protein
MIASATDGLAYQAIAPERQADKKVGKIAAIPGFGRDK